MESLRTKLIQNVKKFSIIGPVEKFTKTIKQISKEGFSEISEEARMQALRDLVMILFWLVLVIYCIMDVIRKQLGPAGYVVAIFFPHMYIVFSFLMDLMNSRSSQSVSQNKYSISDFSATSELFLGETPLN